MRLIDLTGQTFGRLTVLRRKPMRNKKTQWECSCTCGNKTIVQMDNLRNGHTQSCGCLLEENRGKASITHGHYREHRKTPELEAWAGMVQRTSNPKNHAFSLYGGRGIKMHDQWRQSSQAFLKYLFRYLGSRPSSHHSIDRIDANGNYEPGNIRWATRSQQMKNRRPGHSAGERNGAAKLTPAQVIAIRADKRGGGIIAREYGVAKSTINRIRAGTKWGSVPWQ